jgi:hypothetical protein
MLHWLCCAVMTVMAVLSLTAGDSRLLAAGWSTQVREKLRRTCCVLLAQQQRNVCSCAFNFNMFSLVTAVAGDSMS